MTAEELEPYLKARYRELCESIGKVPENEVFDDTVNHGLLIKTVRETEKDEAIIGLIRKFLKSGVMADGLVSQNEQGTPQGGPCRRY
ncbi:MAG: hypothetical protein LBB98_03960 [Treponema sp.]|jgi:hypothetical protein|nr:hypothetical protein [Treponema sp.]